MDQLVKGSAAVSAPSNAESDESFTVLLRVSPGQLAILINELRAEFPENSTVKGRIQ